MWGKIKCFFGFHDYKKFVSKSGNRMKSCKRCGVAGYDWFICPYAPHGEIPEWLCGCYKDTCKDCAVYKALTQPMGKKKGRKK